jgi:hypothetical protein
MADAECDHPMILDLRFPICDWVTGGGNPRSSHERGQFADLAQEPAELPPGAADRRWEPTARSLIANRKSKTTNR